MKKLLVLAICGLFGLSLSAYEWEPYGPPGINAFKIHIFEKDFFCTLLTNSGFYLTEEFDSKTWEHFEFNATGAASYNTDSILLILNEGSYSDGIYVMDVNTHIYNVLTYCERPNFIVKVPEESHYFVGFEGGLYESFDGIDWSELSLFTGTKCLDMASSPDMILLAVDIAFDNAFVSFDQGVSWEPIVDDNKFIEFATMGYYGMFNTMVGITRSWGGGGLYEFNGTQWEILYYSSDIAALGVDNSNAPIIGWNQGTHPDIGIGRYKMNPPNAGITFFNDGLPDQNILDIGKSPPLFGAAWIFCITESGPFVCTGVAVGLDQISTEDQNIEVYPNPTNDILNIQVPIAIKGNSNVIFYDCSGNVVLDRKMSGFRSIIDISLLPSGLYIIKVLDVSGKLIGAEKIIKH